MTGPGYWGMLAGCLLLSFFLSGMEAGVQVLSPLRLRQWMRKGRSGAAVLLGWMEQPERFLWTILVGNTLANFAVVALLVLGLQERAETQPWVFWGGIAGVWGGLYLGCDLLPKVLFRRYPNRLCLHLVGVFRMVHGVLAPLVGMAEWFANHLLRWTGGSRFTGHLFGNRDEFRALMQASAGALSQTERAFIDRVLDLQHATVARLTRPMDAVPGVEVGTPVPAILELCRREGVNRLPVWSHEGKRPRVAGVIRLRDLLYRDTPVSGDTAGQHLRPALFLEETLRLEIALRRMQRSGQHLAIVLGPDGREQGVVWLWDILGWIFGEVKA